ncbi:hypothetical protein HanIR_Chr17g0886801 [Helianthus annuus]|nr:hypothetical protein HanIR_Chr17g0886801 [Helianthus annuus]
MFALLSQYTLIGSLTSTCNSLNKFLSQTVSHAVAHIALYSALAEDLETVVCFLLFQDTKLLPKKRKNL